MSELIRLAEQCEQASEADDGLDRAIVLALAPDAKFEQGGDPCARPIVFHAEPVVGWKCVLPRLTASLDAAMTLVPKGWRVITLGEQIIDDEQPWIAIVSMRRNDLRAKRLNAFAATPALALVAAALKARAAQPPSASPQEGE